MLSNLQRSYYVRMLFLLFALGILLRLYGIEFESFWTDEVFTIDFSSNNVPYIMKINAKDSHPPLFYLGLFVWRSAFPDTDMWIRAYSVVWSMIGLLGIYFLARDMGGYRAALWALVLGVINPLDIYFAQEARMYSQAAALCIMGSWCLWRWMKMSDKTSHLPGIWGWAIAYILCSLGALLTHYLTLLILISQGILALIWFALRKDTKSIIGYLICTCVIINGFLPWIFYVKSLRGDIYNPALSWIPAPTVDEYISFLGREFFWGYVVQIHHLWWIPTMILPISMFIILILSGRRKISAHFEQKSKTGVYGRIYVFGLILLPVLLCVLVTLAYHPIYYRPRFSQLILPPFLVAAGLAINGIKKKNLAVLYAGILGVVMLTGTIYQYATYQKSQWRKYVEAWHNEGPPDLTIFFPWYLDDAASYSLKKRLGSIAQSTMEKILPDSQGSRVWVSELMGYKFEGWEGERDYRSWLSTLGTRRDILLPGDLRLYEIQIGTFDVPDRYAGRFDKWYSIEDIFKQAQPAFVGEQLHNAEKEVDGTPFRWTKPQAILRLYDNDNISTIVLELNMLPPFIPDYKPELRIYAMRSTSETGLFETRPVVYVETHHSGIVDLPFADPGGKEPLWIGITVKGMKPAEMGISEDDRMLGVALRGVGMIKKKG